MKNPPDEGCKRKKFVRQMKSASKVKKGSTGYADSSSSSGDYPTESSESEGSDECRRNLSSRRGMQVIKTAPSEELTEDNSSEDESMESDGVQMPSKDYVFDRKEKVYFWQGGFDLTEGQQERLDALVRTVQPKIPVLVVMMKKTNVKLDAVEILKDYAIKHFPRKAQTITLKLPGKSKDWSCDFRIRPDGRGRNLYLGNFVSDNRVHVGDLCIFQPLTKVDESTFTVTVHLLRQASVDHYPVGRKYIDTNHGIIRKNNSDSVDTPKGHDDGTKQLPGRKIYARCKTGISRGQQNTTKWAAEPTSFEKSGDNSPSENEYFDSGDNRTAQGANYGLSLGSCLSGAQYEKVIAYVERIQPETSVFIALMSQRHVQLPSPLLNISEEHAIAHFPPESVIVTLQRPGRANMWHPRFYMAKDRREYVLTGHWLDFICDNSVQEGDICIFVPEKGGRRSKFTVHLLRGDKTHLRGGTGGGQGVGSRQGKRNANIDSLVHIMEESTEGEETFSLAHEEHGTSEKSPNHDDTDRSCNLPYMMPLHARLTKVQEKKVLEKVGAIASELPIYVSVMTKNRISVCLTFATRYSATYLRNGSRNLVLQLEGKSERWRAELHDVQASLRIGAGWTSFTSDNHLREGDICLFQLMKNEAPLKMIVHIIRGMSTSSICPNTPSSASGRSNGCRSEISGHRRKRAKTAATSSSSEESEENDSTDSLEPADSHESLRRENYDRSSKRPYILPSRSRLSQAQMKVIEEKVQAIQSEVPICICIVKKRKHQMEFCGEYAAAAHLPRGNQTVVLQSMGKTWETRMNVSNGGRWFLCGGWFKFADDNLLQVGDICLFELKKSERKLTMMVHIIFRKEC